MAIIPAYQDVLMVYMLIIILKVVSNLVLPSLYNMLMILRICASKFALLPLIILDKILMMGVENVSPLALSQVNMLIL